MKRYPLVFLPIQIKIFSHRHRLLKVKITSLYSLSINSFPTEQILFLELINSSYMLTNIGRISLFTILFHFQ
ncbi:hypothetical protein BLO02_016850 [Bacillus cereus]|nr:hypothetical protein BLO02_016850 [Bacillus cereus]